MMKFRFNPLMKVTRLTLIFILKDSRNIRGIISNINIILVISSVASGKQEEGGKMLEKNGLSIRCCKKRQRSLNIGENWIKINFPSRLS